MGCGISKPEDGVDSPAAGRPLHRRFDDIRRLRLGGTRGRKNSTVSNAHLLKPEEDEDVSAAEASTEEPCTSEIICNFSVCTACGSRLSHPAETGEDIIPVTLRPQPNALESESEKLIEVCEVAAEEKEETGAKDNFLKTNEIEEEEKEEESEKAHICGGRSGLICDEDDLPGSPSFRVYFVGVAEEAMEEESQDNDDTTREKTEESRIKGTDSSNSESDETEAKTSTRSKGRRFRRLTRRHSAVHVLFKGQLKGTTEASACIDSSAS